MRIDVARAALGFLSRAQLQGQEVEAFQTVRKELADIVEGRTVCSPAPKPKKAAPTPAEPDLEE